MQLKCQKINDDCWSFAVQGYRYIYFICFTVRSYKIWKHGVKNLVWDKKYLVLLPKSIHLFNNF